MDNEVGIPSFGKGGPGVPQSFCVLVSLSQNKASGSWPSARAGYQDSGADLFTVDGQELFGVTASSSRSALRRGTTNIP